MKQNDVVDKTVIGSDGYVVGTVKEVAFSLDGKLGLVVVQPEGAEETISLESVSGIGDYVVLRSAARNGRAAAAVVAPVAPVAAEKPVVAAPQPVSAPAPAATGTGCPHCGRPVKTGARFCGGCGKPTGV